MISNYVLCFLLDVKNKILIKVFFLNYIVFNIVRVIVKYKIINFDIGEVRLYIEGYVSYIEEVGIFYIILKILCKEV